MSDVSHSIDVTPLKTKGFQHITGFLNDEVKKDLARRAEEIIQLRQSGKLTTHDQDSQGLDNDWFKPLLHIPELVALATSILGPDVCASGWRILAKDKHFKGEIHVHQDWPYNPGDTRKLTAFLPLTEVNKANGSLYFLEESHFYGPVSRGPIDISRFDPMVATCPSADIGDVIICDFLTWHYSLPSENERERLMIQINYQPASDASGSYLVAGKLPHNRRILSSRFDAASVPSVELNAKQARSYFESGDIDRATRYARGVLFDDPDNASAAMLLYDILSQRKDPSALGYLEMARVSLAKLRGELAVRDGAPLSSEDAAPAPTDANTAWREVQLDWKSFVPTHPDVDLLPANLATPELAWGYGAISGLLDTQNPATVRIRAKALSGKIGLCLLDESCSELVSEQHVLEPGTGDATVMIAFHGKASARLLVRNFDDDGVAGEIALQSVSILEY